MSKPSLKQTLTDFVSHMPDNDAELTPTRGPVRVLPVTYYGRPNWCGGALVTVRTPQGETEDRRTSCHETLGPGQTLCDRCAEIEREWRRRRRERLANATRAADDEKQATVRGVRARRPT